VPFRLCYSTCSGHGVSGVALATTNIPECWDLPYLVLQTWRTFGRSWSTLNAGGGAPSTWLHGLLKMGSDRFFRRMQAGKFCRCLHSSVTILQDLSTEDRIDLGGSECLHYTVGAMAARLCCLMECSTFYVDSPCHGKLGCPTVTFWDSEMSHHTRPTSALSSLTMLL
jgi:hypothetical protein